MVNRIHLGEFIESLRNTDDYIQHIYTKGGCYKFHLLLKKLYKGCTPYISQRKDHIITLHEGKYYDIYGEVSHVEGFTKLTKEELDLVNQWSFHNHNLLRLTDCPHCEEPLTIEI